MGSIIIPPTPTCLEVRRSDPDDTVGRALYRQLAEGQVRADTAIDRAVRLMPEVITCQSCGTPAGRLHGPECPAAPLDDRTGRDEAAELRSAPQNPTTKEGSES